MEQWAQWVETSIFQATVTNSLEIDAVDKSSEWWLLDPSGDNDVTVGVDWSTFRFQPVGTGGQFTDDYRFSPATLDLQVYIYNLHDEGDGDDTNNVTFTDLGTITLEGAMESLKQTSLGLVAGIVALQFLY